MSRQVQAARAVLPVGLLVEGKRCLVVGGGKVAAQKVAVLLDAGAAVTVVSPQAGPQIGELGAANKVRHVARVFEEADVDAACLVYAATDDPGVNDRVMQACRARGRLCGRVDAGWGEGDFITPAIIRKDGLTLSVSSGGRSCRRSRDVKEALMRFLESEDNPGKDGGDGA